MAQPIDNEYWLRRWREGQTGWHQADTEEALVRYLGTLAPTRVLVPLCGKSLDLTWLAKQRHEVTGVELSQLACETFFREQGLPFETRPSGAFTRYFSAKLPGASILQGDFFDVSAADIAPLGAIYDRAALIALPPDLRARYAAHLIELSRKASEPGMPLQLVLEGPDKDTGGPPFSISESLLRSLYERDFKIELLEREDAEIKREDGARVFQCVYLLTLR